MISMDNKLPMNTQLAFKYEEKFWEEDAIMIGVDEVGKGALSGPVYAGVVCFNPLVLRDRISYIESIGINDSKKISSLKRESICRELMTGICYWGVGSADVTCIDSFGISFATKLAIHHAIRMALSTMPRKRIHLVVDGYGFSTRYNGIEYNLEGIIKGDGSVLSIAAASIIAKVARDRYMCELGKQYPVYGYEKHKGYGTLMHRTAIQKWGVTPHHRKLFVRNIGAL